MAIGDNLRKNQTSQLPHIAYNLLFNSIYRAKLINQAPLGQGIGDRVWGVGKNSPKRLGYKPLRLGRRKNKRQFLTSSSVSYRAESPTP